MRQKLQALIHGAVEKVLIVISLMKQAL